MVIFERVTDALQLGMVTTLPAPPPSMMVVVAPEPMILKLKPIVRFSV